MMISTKGRYALRVMIDLAQHNTGEYITLDEIAKRQDISEKYLESIIVILSKASLLDAVRGKKGGYKLSRKPEEYNINEILTLLEGTLAPVSCLSNSGVVCENAADCRTLPLWIGLDNVINEYLNNYTLADLIK